MTAPSGFRADRVPPALDAVVIGSGVGGLSAAVLLAKAGKRVLVLEQHDQAGGCTHTFHNKGFEFDVGKYPGNHLSWHQRQEAVGCVRVARKELTFMGSIPHSL